MDKTRIKILVSFCSHIRCTGIYTGNFGYLFLSLQKSQNTVNSPKKINFLHVFRCKMLYKSGSEWVINNPLCKYLQNVVRNTTGKFGVCQCCWSGDFSLRVWEKTHFEKTAFKDLHCKILYGKMNGIYRRITDKVEWNENT